MTKCSVAAVGGRRYRETFGGCYEEFTVGDIYEHRPGRTITETDNIGFTLLTMKTHPAHFDAHYAARSEFKKPLVNSCLTLSMVVDMSVSDISQRAVANVAKSTPGQSTPPGCSCRCGGVRLRPASPHRRDAPGFTGALSISRSRRNVQALLTSRWIRAAISASQSPCAELKE